MILTAGRAAYWNGGDSGEYVEEAWYWPGVPELQTKVGGAGTFDAAGLAFDVYCAHGQLELEYQFGSEEYDEFVGDFHDSFMITVDDVVVSLLPDASDIVAVNILSAGNPDDPYFGPMNQHLFLDDDEDIDPLAAAGNQAAQVEYDGMTIRLKVHAFVSAGATHRVRIVIADVSDARYDSTLFLKQNSLRTIIPQP